MKWFSVAVAASALLMSACAGPQVSESEARAEYERIASLRSSVEYNVRHILVETPSEAAAVVVRIAAGESFGSVARAVSRDPESARQGGEMGWNDPGNFVPEFSRAMVKLAPKGISLEPVQSPFGWHVIEVTATRTADFPPFEEVKGQITQRLKQQRAAQAASGASYLHADTGCAVVAGGAIGDELHDPVVDDFWFKANRGIAQRLTDRLKSSGANVVGVTFPVASRTDLMATVQRAIAGHRCNRLAMLSHTIRSDEQGNFFQFELTVLRAVPTSSGEKGQGGTQVSMQREYKQVYRYRRSKESIDSFDVDGFAALLTADLRADPVFTKIR